MFIFPTQNVVSCSFLSLIGSLQGRIKYPHVWIYFFAYLGNAVVLYYPRSAARDSKKHREQFSEAQRRNEVVWMTQTMRTGGRPALRPQDMTAALMSRGALHLGARGALQTHLSRPFRGLAQEPERKRENSN